MSTLERIPCELECAILAYVTADYSARSAISRTCQRYRESFPRVPALDAVRCPALVQMLWDLYAIVDRSVEGFYASMSMSVGIMKCAVISRVDDTMRTFTYYAHDGTPYMHVSGVSGGKLVFIIDAMPVTHSRYAGLPTAVCICRYTHKWPTMGAALVTRVLDVVNYHTIGYSRANGWYMRTDPA